MTLTGAAVPIVAWWGAGGEWALIGMNGSHVCSEPRRLAAGYRWPQYAVHRGGLQMLLYRKVIERLGPEAVRTGELSVWRILQLG